MQKFQTQIFQPSEKATYYFYTEGDKSKPALCIVPGFTGTHSDLLPLARVLSATNYVIVPDLPGWGKSSDGLPELTIFEYAIYLDTLFQQLQIKEIVMVGHCMGAATAIAFANKFPSKTAKVFLVSPPYQKGTLSYKVFYQLAHWSLRSPKSIRPLFFLWRNRIVGAGLGLVVIQSRSWKKKLRRVWYGMTTQRQQNEKAVEENWISLILFSFEEIQDIKKPIHVIHGAKDIMIPMSQVNKLMALVPHATLDVLVDAGHLPPIETPITLGHTIQKYL